MFLNYQLTKIHKLNARHDAETGNDVVCGLIMFSLAQGYSLSERSPIRQSARTLEGSR